jgi:hypothetical protein
MSEPTLKLQPSPALPLSAHLLEVTSTCLIVFAGLTGLLGCDFAQSPSQKSSAVANAQRSVEVLDLNDRPFDFWQREPSPATVIVFTRSDCPISNRFAPEISRLYETYHPEGVEFLLIYVDPSEKPDAIHRHLQEYTYPCQALRDPQHSLVRFCNASVTPEAVVFDRKQAITYMGRINDLYPALGTSRSQPTTHDLADAIESTVLGRPVAVPRTKAIGCLITDLAN